MRQSLLPPVLLMASLLAGCSDGRDQPPRAPVAPSSLTIAPTAVPEGAPGEMAQLRFRASMTEPQPEPVLIRYSTETESAVGDVDFLPAEGEVTIPPGALAAEITVEVFGNAEDEPAKTLRLNYEVDGNAVPTGTAAVGTIANDDAVCDAPFAKEPNPWRVFGADPLNYAHRGGVIDFPENTLYAYAEVALVGADVLEMDVYQTLDNELVILHDLTVDRTTNGSGRVVDLTLAELRQLDAAYWFVPGVGTPRDRPEEDYVFRGIATGERPPPPGYSPEDFRIPTLEEALQRFAAERLNVELKPDLDGEGDYEQQIAGALLRYGRIDDVIAASFVDEAATAFKAAAPCIPTSVPLGQGTNLVLAALGDGTIPPVPEHVAFQVPPDTSQITGDGQLPEDFFLEVVTKDFITDSHNANLAVQVWTINDCEEMLRLMALGVDAIMTDRPVLLQSLLDTPPEQRSCD
ncbi:glycerophosphodiester phosphodiesterase family protein [Haliea sp. E1-2-M8]|uniref:glycerophosphodiester phosphodiesterase family protein n=1 Tax=Haliea sp. E1-2-M8 TaxID=3064706 RepID=UPI00271D6A5D|nr:glycerophosphodiester phosphodiesterase family protein [Haliea sp. E1-2-M8]MDO8861069.1 glycerophosphodiester phosphodiesterase family protein [Haliea sp. E1-2-M8]